MNVEFLVYFIAKRNKSLERKWQSICYLTYSFGRKFFVKEAINSSRVSRLGNMEIISNVLEALCAIICGKTDE
jgi:hypothetical protein